MNTRPLIDEHARADLAVTRHADTHERAQAVLRNTYWLLALTLAFSAIVTTVALTLELPALGIVPTLAGYFGLLFLTYRLRQSNWGLAAVFGLTGFLGYTLGPLLDRYLALGAGPEIVATALGTTAMVFVGLSAYARSSVAVSFSKLGTFLFVGILTAFALGLVAVFFSMPALSLAVSGMFVLLMSGLIIYETQNIVNGGERNYILATVTLYVAIYNLFSSLLHLLGALSGDDG